MQKCMDSETKAFAGVAEMIKARQPVSPVYCIYPHIYRETAREFVSGFPGRVLYAVKANDHPDVIRLLHEGGVTHFDCASVPEIERVREACEDVTPYFMVPVRLRGAARDAQSRLHVRHFMVDHLSGIEPLAQEIDMRRAVVFARMAVHHESAMQDLSAKFGAPPDEMPAILHAIRDAGAEPALAFNVGSGVTSVDAYSYAIELAESVLRKLPFAIRLVDIGGGYPKSYPGFAVPPLQEYFNRIRDAAARLPLADGGEVMGEPGRALAGPGLSAVVEVLLRKNNRLYLNDGMYGIFWELRFRGHDRYPLRAYRHGEGMTGGAQKFKLFGPTCDGTDVMPGEVELPSDIRPGDYLEFGAIGAYSLAGRTSFNGHYSDDIVTIDNATAIPPE